MLCYALDLISSLSWEWFADFFVRTLDCSKVYYKVP